MGTPTAVLLSYRLGGQDGVSVEARKWQWALESLDFTVRRVAGEFDDDLASADLCLPFLSRERRTGRAADSGEIGVALGDADLIVVENLCSLPLNVDAARAAASALATFPGRVLFHHHDLPWERPGFESCTEFPPRRPNSLQVVISDQARRALAARGIDAVMIRNAFDVDPKPGVRAVRTRLGFGRRDVVVLQPTRAIARKDVGRGLSFAEALAIELSPLPVRFWLTGPAEDGFGPELASILGAARVPTTHRRVDDVADAYAAADLVVMPSQWEGFGNPLVEAMIAKRPVASASYPVLGELVGLGLQVLPIDDPPAVARFLARPDPAVLEHNYAVAARELALADLPGRLADAFRQVGWVDW
jgi:mannosylglucosylglycerate synthase